MGKTEEIKPPNELFVAETNISGNWISGCYTTRQELIAHRLQNQTWDRRDGKDTDTEPVFVYKFSHVEIIRKKLEIFIEKP